MVTPKQKSALKKWSFTPCLLHFTISKRIKLEKCDCTHLEALFKCLKTVKDYLLFNKRGYEFAQHQKKYSLYLSLTVQ